MQQRGRGASPIGAHSQVVAVREEVMTLRPSSQFLVPYRTVHACCVLMGFKLDPAPRLARRHVCFRLGFDPPQIDGDNISNSHQHFRDQTKYLVASREGRTVAALSPTHN